MTRLIKIEAILTDICMLRSFRLTNDYNQITVPITHSANTDAQVLISM